MAENEVILVTGADSFIGRELIIALRSNCGSAGVIAADKTDPGPEQVRDGHYVQLDVKQKLAIEDIVIRRKVTAIYHLSEVRCASCEKNPANTWNMNISGLTNVLDVAKIFGLKVFWPSSIAVFGPGPSKRSYPQNTIAAPTTLYGITKIAGEHLCNYYHEHYGVDVRSIRLPGLISYCGTPAGTSSRYTIGIYYEASRAGTFNSFLENEAVLPMIYMPDAVRAILELMNAKSGRLKIRTAYNVSAMSVSPRSLTAAINFYQPDIAVEFVPELQQVYADCWPASIDYREASEDWGWKPKYDLPAMAKDILDHGFQQDNNLQ